MTSRTDPPIVVSIYFLLWPKINCSQMKLPNFVSPYADNSSKIGHDFANKAVRKLKLSINHFLKKCAHKQLFFNEKSEFESLDKK